MFCFHVRQSDFLQSIQGQTWHGCINHDKVVGLCSKLLMKISIEHADKSFGLYLGIEPRTTRSWVVFLNHSTKALSKIARKDLRHTVPSDNLGVRKFKILVDLSIDQGIDATKLFSLVIYQSRVIFSRHTHVVKIVTFYRRSNFTTQRSSV